MMDFDQNILLIGKVFKSNLHIIFNLMAIFNGMKLDRDN